MLFKSWLPTSTLFSCSNILFFLLILFPLWNRHFDIARKINLGFRPAYIFPFLILFEKDFGTKYILEQLPLKSQAWNKFHKLLLLIPSVSIYVQCQFFNNPFYFWKKKNHLILNFANFQYYLSAFMFSVSVFMLALLLFRRYLWKK